MPSISPRLSQLVNLVYSNVSLDILVRYAKVYNKPNADLMLTSHRDLYSLIMDIKETVSFLNYFIKFYNNKGVKAAYLQIPNIKNMTSNANYTSKSQLQRVALSLNYIFP